MSELAFRLTCGCWGSGLHPQTRSVHVQSGWPESGLLGQIGDQSQHPLRVRSSGFY